MNKKPGTGPAGKSGTGLAGKSAINRFSGSKTGGGFVSSSSSGKSDSSKKSTPKSSFGLGALGSNSSGKSPIFGASSSKNYPVYSSPKSNKTSAGFGIIWLPGRRNNKKKDIVYTGHNDSYPKGQYERTPTMYNFMGDSPDSKPAKNKEEEVVLLMPEKSKLPMPEITAVGTVVTTSEMPADSTEKPEEKQQFIKREENEPKEVAAGDTNEKAFKSDKDDDYLDNEKAKNKTEKSDSEKHEDNVDSVFLRPPPPHKRRSTPSTVEQDDCGITCLYYTLQCCECVVM